MTKDKSLYTYQIGKMTVITDEAPPDNYAGLDFDERIAAMSQACDDLYGTDGFLVEVNICLEMGDHPEEIAHYVKRPVADVEKALERLRAAEKVSGELTETACRMGRENRHVRDIAAATGLDEATVQAVLARDLG